MARLRFEECKNCVDWNGNRAHCMDICSKPLLAWDEFNRYKEAEEQGLLIRLPCKVGTIVYKPIAYFSAFDLEEKKEVIESRFGLSMIDDIGKTVFLTKEEAEQALKEGVK